MGSEMCIRDSYEGMALTGEFSEFPGECFGECLECGFAGFIVDCRRPNPSDT